MELYPEDSPRGIFHRSRATSGCFSQYAESGRWRRHQIAMRHPDLLMVPDPAQQPRIVRQKVEDGQAKFALIAFLYVSPEQLRDQLLAVANAQHGNAGFEHRSFNRGAGIVVNAVRAARNDDASRAPQLL